jgi:hypothetical protein
VLGVWSESHAFQCGLASQDQSVSDRNPRESASRPSKREVPAGGHSSGQDPVAVEISNVSGLVVDDPIAMAREDLAALTAQAFVVQDVGLGQAAALFERLRGAEVLFEPYVRPPPGSRCTIAGKAIVAAQPIAAEDGEPVIGALTLVLIAAVIFPPW